MSSGVKVFLKTSLSNSIYFGVKFTKRLFMMPEGTCRFTPTCSQYAREALRELPLFVALPLIAKRVGSCHPKGGFGYDPVPLKENNLTENSKEK
jgi:putative membrane protein insertion efficiency factor